MPVAGERKRQFGWWLTGAIRTIVGFDVCGCHDRHCEVALGRKSVDCGSLGYKRSRPAHRTDLMLVGIPDRISPSLSVQCIASTVIA